MCFLSNHSGKHILPMEHDTPRMELKSMHELGVDRIYGTNISSLDKNLYHDVFIFRYFLKICKVF